MSKNETTAALNRYMGSFFGGKKKSGLPAGIRGVPDPDRRLAAYLVNGDPVYAANRFEAARVWVSSRDDRPLRYLVARDVVGGNIEVSWPGGSSGFPVRRLTTVQLAGWKSRRRSAGKSDDFDALAIRFEDLPA